MTFKLKHCEIKTYVNAADYQAVTSEALARRTSIAKVLRDCIREYFILRHDLANAIETPGVLGDSHSGKIIYTFDVQNSLDNCIQMLLLQHNINFDHQ